MDAGDVSNRSISTWLDAGMTLDSTISRMLSDYHGDAVIEPTEEFDGDLSRDESRRFVIRAIIAVGVAIGFIVWLMWVMS